ncbi:MAG: PINc protein [Candidatus Levybacteria bacterium]|nr:PINc protein [Candidatus Levybacteria bacterium]
MEIFVDSDVIISSLISKSGAAYMLLRTEAVVPIISSTSQKEIEIVQDRLQINEDGFKELLQKRLKVISLPTSIGKIKEIFKKYVLDINDTHIISGAKEAKVRFLITYNLKDFKIERIREDFNIIVLTPGQILQYLRSLKL